MLSIATYTLLASGALAAAGSVQRRWEYPEGFLATRQEQPNPGTPPFLCHENCGTLIPLARDDPEGYCELEEYHTRFQACMECALTFNIWRFYRFTVTPGAQACGLVIAPSPSGWTPTVTSTTPPSQPSTEPSVTDKPAASSTDEPAVSSAQPPAAISSVASSVTPSAAPSVATSAEPSAEPSATDAASSHASSSKPSSAPSSGVDEPSTTGGVPHPVSSGSDAATTPAASSTEDCETTVTVTSTEDSEKTISIYVPVGNQTTLGTVVYPIPSESGSMSSQPGASQTTHVGPVPTESFVASSAAQLVGSFCAAAVAAVAILAAF